MLVSGALSTMNMWADSLDHVYFSLNDVYMVSLMTGWMFLLMGLYYKETQVSFFGFVLTAFSFYAIRTQLFVTETQFLRGMIPHHSMAILMSKRLLEKPTSLQRFAKQIIQVQEKEIQFMKSRI
jgi:hypothetical protein